MRLSSLSNLKSGKPHTWHHGYPKGEPAQQKGHYQSCLDCYAEQDEHADASCLEWAQDKMFYARGLFPDRARLQLLSHG